METCQHLIRVWTSWHQDRSQRRCASRSSILPHLIRGLSAIVTTQPPSHLPPPRPSRTPRVVSSPTTSPKLHTTRTEVMLRRHRSATRPAFNTRKARKRARERQLSRNETHTTELLWRRAPLNCQQRRCFDHHRFQGPLFPADRAPPLRLRKPRLLLLHLVA